MTRRILIIDDDTFIRDVTQVTLSKVAGWSAITAGSGLEGLEQAKQNNLDAILLDVSMPGMDGFAVFEELQADPKTRSIPVILLTAKAIPADTTPLTQMGLAGVIVKPFDPLEVCHQISKLLHWEVD
ncbi:response regulator [Leptolyngbya ohadii]|uniref:response regulator n=1 Tax=Leptolyngbya ohadii TaxID=1962290 RepID=UPI000B59EB57|nr:response regulator [Leptolyngbya ohadii]